MRGGEGGEVCEVRGRRTGGGEMCEGRGRRRGL